QKRERLAGGDCVQAVERERRAGSQIHDRIGGQRQAVKCLPVYAGVRELQSATVHLQRTAGRQAIGAIEFESTARNLRDTGVRADSGERHVTALGFDQAEVRDLATVREAVARTEIQGEGVEPGTARNAAPDTRGTAFDIQEIVAALQIDRGE